MTQDPLNGLGFDFRLVHQPVGKRVTQVVESKPLAVLDGHSGLLCPPVADDRRRKQRRIEEHGRALSRKGTRSPHPPRRGFVPAGMGGSTAVAEALPKRTVCSGGDPLWKGLWRKRGPESEWKDECGALRLGCPWSHTSAKSPVTESRMLPASSDESPISVAVSACPTWARCAAKIALYYY